MNDTSCPHCGSPAKTAMIAGAFWECGTGHIESDLCREREAHNQTKRERDEARKHVEFRRELYKVQEQYLEKARRERDDAMEQNAKLRDIAERARLFCDMRMRDSLRAELDQLKEGAK